MARVRSPNYPALSLPEAIQMISKVFTKENRHKADKEVVVKAMGYSGINGASMGSLSALLKYGLLDQEGASCRVSDRAMAILHPHSPQEKAQAISDAAREPALFAEMLTDFPGSIPSDDNLRSYLVRRGFNSNALSPVISAFRETMGLVGSETGAYDSPVPAFVESDEPALGSQMSAATLAPMSVPAAGSGGFQINVHTDRLVLSGTFFAREMVQDLIDKLTAIKAFLPEQAIVAGTLTVHTGQPDAGDGKPDSL